MLYSRRVPNENGGNMQHLAWDGFFLPLVGFLIILATSNCIRR